MSSTSDDTMLPLPHRLKNYGGLDGETVLPSIGTTDIHIPGDVIDNRYTVVREIGRGGMGVVYEVEDAVTARLYAIKRLLPQLASSETVVRAFVREGTAAEQFSTSSPHFVTTKTVGKDAGGFYVLMELVNLPTLRQVLRESGRLELNRAMQILTSLASGLADLHKANLIHRDLKPENVFLDESEHATTTRLVDFGLTREVTANSTIGMSGGGSLKYMAPEQFRDEPATMASDVYAFGVIAYEMLTGELPTYGESLTDYVQDSPDQLVKVITRCLAGKVERRIDNAITLSRELVVTSSQLSATAPRREIERSSVLSDANILDTDCTGVQSVGGTKSHLFGPDIDTLSHDVESTRQLRLLYSGNPDETVEYPAVNRTSFKEFSDLYSYVVAMRRIPAATFQMGNPSGFENEQTCHYVSMSDFWLGSTPVTVKMWKEYCNAAGKTMPMAPTWGWRDDHPVVNVSWFDIMGGMARVGFANGQLPYLVYN